MRVKLVLEKSESERVWYIVPRICKTVGDVVSQIEESFYKRNKWILTLRMEGFELLKRDLVDIIRDGDTIQLNTFSFSFFLRN